MRVLSRGLLAASVSGLALLGVAGPAAAQAAADKEVLSEIVVTGVRAAQRKAVDLKRGDDKVSDSIVAEDIGKLPDITIADSLQRVTGVQIEREAGEGGRVSIRGMPNVLTTLNNDMMLSATNVLSTAPNYADIPAQLISSASVYKSTTADLLSGGVSAVIEMKTRRPLDLKSGLNFTGSAERSHGSIGGYDNDVVSLFSGYRSRDKRWGVIASAAYSKGTNANYRNNFDNNSYDLQTDATAFLNPLFNSSNTNLAIPEADVLAWTPQFYDFRGDGKGPESCPGFVPWGDFYQNSRLAKATAGNRYTVYERWLQRNNIACINAGDYVYTPRMLAFNRQELNRERQAFNVSGQFSFTKELTGSAELFYSKIEDRNPFINMYFHNDSRFDRLTPGVERPIVGENGVVEFARQKAYRIITRGGNSLGLGEAFNSMYTLDYKGKGPLSWTARFVSSNNSRLEENASFEGLFNPSTLQACPGGVDPEDSPVPCTTTDGINPGYDMSFDIRGGTPIYKFYDGNLAADKQRWNAFSGGGNDQKGSLQAASFSGVWRERYWIIEALKFGARQSNQEIERVGYSIQGPVFNRYPGQAFASFFSVGSFPAAHTFLTQFPNNNGLISNYPGWTKEYRDFGGLPVPGNLVAIPNTDLLSNPAQFLLDVYKPWTTADGRVYEGRKFFEPVNNYKYDVKSLEAYLQADFSGDVPFIGWEYRGNLGVRMAKNKQLITRNKIRADITEGLGRQIFIDGVEVAPATGSCYYKFTRVVTATGVPTTATGAGTRDITVDDAPAKDPNNLVPCVTREYPGGPFKSLGTEVIENTTTDYLPNINLRLSPRPSVAIRFGWNKSMGRPDLGIMGRGLTFNRTPNNQSVPSLPPSAALFISQEEGNPRISPFRATNTNLSLEWYPDRETLLQFAAFNMAIDTYPQRLSSNCIGQDDVPSAFVDANGQPIVSERAGTCTTTVDGTDAYLRGVEVGIKRPLTFLPGIWSGLGIDANYTFSQSGDFGKTLDPASLPRGANLADWEAALQAGQKDVEGNFMPVSQFSKHAANFVLWYQKRGLQARIAANWRSDRFSHIRTVPQSALSVAAEPAIAATGNVAGYPAVAMRPDLVGQRFAAWYQPAWFLDASVSYDINRNATIYLQGSNLTENSDRRYAQYKNLFMDSFQFDRRITFGMRFKM